MNWLSPFRRTRTPRTRQALPRPHRVKPGLEVLEDRVTPTTFSVNSTMDLPIVTGGGASLVDPATGAIAGTGGIVTLRSAIQAANATPGGNTILLTVPGTITLMPESAANAEDTAGAENNQTGDLDILPSGGDLTITNASGGTVAVDGGGTSRVFDINPTFFATGTPAGTAKFTVTLANFTVQNGSASPGDAATGSGGGIRDQGNASLTLSNMVVQNNKATADGGGIAMENTVSTPWTLTILNSTISGNSANDAGGGVETDGHGTVAITNSKILNNTCVNQGAGLWLDAITNMATGVNESATAALNGDTFDGNKSTAALNGTAPNVGGGIGNAGDASNAKTGAALKTGVTIANSTVSNNSAAGEGGGFGDENMMGTLTVTNSKFLNNTAGFSGGGIFTTATSVTITNSTFTGNTATGNPTLIAGTQGAIAVGKAMVNAPSGSGGGIWAASPTTTITGSTFQGNTAKTVGGGVFVLTSGSFLPNGGTFLLQNSTITGNTATGTVPDAPDIFGQVTDLAASTGNTIGVTDADTNLANGSRGGNIEFQTAAGLQGVLVNANGHVIQFSAAGTKIDVTNLLNLGPSIFASVAFTSFGEILILTQADGTVMDITVANGQGSITDLTGIVGKARAASVGFTNGILTLVVTSTTGQLTLFNSAGSVLNLTQLLTLNGANGQPNTQSASVDFNAFNGQLTLLVTNTNGTVTEFTSGGQTTNLTPSLTGTLRKTASPAFPGPDATGLSVVYVDESGNLIITTIQNGVSSTTNLGPAPLG